MKEFLLGLAVGAAAGGVVALVQANRARTRYADQGAALAAKLASDGAQVQQALEAGGAAFRTELEAVARATALAVAQGRAATLITQVYGLNAQTLAKLEAYRNAID